MKYLTFGDIAVIIPFAWVLSQSILHGGILWGVLAWILFNQYASRRVDW